MVLGPARDRRSIAEEIENIRLVGDKSRSHVDAAIVKHAYGGMKR